MYNAIVVLANLMDRAGNLNEESLTRLSTACDLWKEGVAPVLVTCGWAYRNDSDICIAEAMARVAINEMGLPPSDVLTEIKPRDTVGDAVFTKRNIADPRGWESIAVVTSAYHVDRTRQIFSFVYGYPVYVAHAPSAQSLDLEALERKSLAAFHRTFSGVEAGDIDAVYRRLVSAHPFYNGSVYPQIG